MPLNGGNTQATTFDMIKREFCDSAECCVAVLFLTTSVAKPPLAQVPSLSNSLPRGDFASSLQQSSGSAQEPAKPATAPDNNSKADSPQPKVEPDDQSEQQTKRILWIIPNYRSVSANTYLPPQSFGEKLWPLRTALTTRQ
jgi:hypothetical protein